MTGPMWIAPGARGRSLREQERPMEAVRVGPATPRKEPFFVQRARATRGVGPTRCRELKLVFVSRGETEIFHSGGAVSLSPGTMAFLPADQTYWGVPSTFVETIAVYVRPDFAEEQLRWLPRSAGFLEWIAISKQEAAPSTHRA